MQRRAAAPYRGVLPDGKVALECVRAALEELVLGLVVRQRITRQDEIPVCGQVWTKRPWCEIVSESVCAVYVPCARV